MTDDELRQAILAEAARQGWPSLWVQCAWPNMPVQHNFGPGENMWRSDLEYGDTAHLVALHAALMSRAQETA